jgi:DNA-binding LacI/PurR family transcriptional regulator
MSETTVVQQVASRIRKRIVRQRMKRGAPLPSYRQLSLEEGVSYVSVKQGMDVLVAQGIVRQQRGQGCFVAKELWPAPRPLKHVGLIYSARLQGLFARTYVAEIMHGFAMAMPADADLNIFSIHDEGLIKAAHLGERAVDGVMLLAVENDAYLRDFATWGTPGVVVDYCPDDVRLDYVACDNADAARRMVEHLATLGHRRVVYVSQHPCDARSVSGDETRTLLITGSSDLRERHTESVRALRDRGMLAAEIYPSDMREDFFARVARNARQWQGRADGPTAIIVDSEYTAFYLLQVLTASGIRVPQDLSVCAVAGCDAPELRGPLPWTHCRFDFAAMGRTAAELLAARCLHPKIDAPVARRIGFTFEEGQTTGRVKPS